MVQTAAMTIHPLASPYSAPARPELTGGRRIGVLLSHGFTGQPASMTPWGQHLAGLGYAVEVPRLPGHGTTWQELNTQRWADWYGEVTRSLDKLVAENDAVVVGGLSMGGALVLRLAEDRPEIAGVVVVNPAVASKRLDVKLLPVLKHLVGSFPGIANDIKKEGVEEHGYTKTPLKAIHSFMQAWPSIIARPAEDHRAPALLPLDRGPRRRRGVAAADHQRGLLARRDRRTARRTATTSPRSTTTPRRSSRTPPTSSPE